MKGHHVLSRTSYDINDKEDNIMFKKFIIASAAVLLAACSTSQLTSEQKAEQRRQVAKTIQEAIDGRNFAVSIKLMMPNRGPSVHVDPGYMLRIKGDSIYSYLPYFGRAYSVPYGGGNSLDFQTTLMGYNRERIKNKYTRVYIAAKNENDTYQYTLEVFDNGHCVLSVTSRNRESISFDGEMMGLPVK